MQISITIPLKADIIHSTKFQLSVARSNDRNRWSKAHLLDLLGDYAERQGVYIHHSAGKILYISKTTDGNFNFGERLYRQFHEGASKGGSPYPLLAEQTKPIYSYFLDLEDIDKMVNAGSMSISSKEKALVMELILIGIYKPIGNKNLTRDEGTA